jgi:glutathione S-transferase
VPLLPAIVDATNAAIAPITIFGANAICRYLAVKYYTPAAAAAAAPGSLPFMGVSSPAIEDLLDAEEAKLEPAVDSLEAAIEKSGSSGGSGSISLPLDDAGIEGLKAVSPEVALAFNNLKTILARFEASPAVFSSPLVPLVLFPNVFRALHIKGGDRYPTLAGIIGAVMSSASYRWAVDAAADALQATTVQQALKFYSSPTDASGNLKCWLISKACKSPMIPGSFKEGMYPLYVTLL